MRTTVLTKDDVRVKRSSAGLGLFAAVPLRKGRYIEYVGSLLTAEEANRKTRAKYLFELNSKWTIDGSVRSNLARYINHACKPNCESEQVGKRIFIEVTRPIKAGEELTYDYGREYVEEYITPQGCKCASCSHKVAMAGDS